MAQFDKDILKIEGGYSNDPLDRGGETKFGISKRTFPNINIAALTFDDALEIYKTHFWTKNRLGEINDQLLANIIFLFVIHRNAADAIKLVQRSLNECGYPVAVDGVMGRATLNAINTSYQKWLADRIRLNICAYYLRVVEKNPSQDRFFNGWIRRALL